MLQLSIAVLDVLITLPVQATKSSSWKAIGIDIQDEIAQLRPQPFDELWTNPFTASPTLVEDAVDANGKLGNVLTQESPSADHQPPPLHQDLPAKTNSSPVGRLRAEINAHGRLAKGDEQTFQELGTVTEVSPAIIPLGKASHLQALTVDGNGDFETVSMTETLPEELQPPRMREVLPAEKDSSPSTALKVEPLVKNDPSVVKLRTEIDAHGNLVKDNEQAFQELDVVSDASPAIVPIGKSSHLQALTVDANGDFETALMMEARPEDSQRAPLQEAPPMEKDTAPIAGLKAEAAEPSVQEVPLVEKRSSPLVLKRDPSPGKLQTEIDVHGNIVKDNPAIVPLGKSSHLQALTVDANGDFETALMMEALPEDAQRAPLQEAPPMEKNTAPNAGLKAEPSVQEVRLVEKDSSPLPVKKDPSLGKLRTEIDVHGNVAKDKEQAFRDLGKVTEASPAIAPRGNSSRLQVFTVDANGDFETVSPEELQPPLMQEEVPVEKASSPKELWPPRLQHGLPAGNDSSPLAELKIESPVQEKASVVNKVQIELDAHGNLVKDRQAFQELGNSSHLQAFTVEANGDFETVLMTESRDEAPLMQEDVEKAASPKGLQSPRMQQGLPAGNHSSALAEAKAESPVQKEPSVVNKVRTEIDAHGNLVKDKQAFQGTETVTEVSPAIVPLDKSSHLQALTVDGNGDFETVLTTESLPEGLQSPPMQKVLPVQKDGPVVTDVPVQKEAPVVTDAPVKTVAGPKAIQKPGKGQKVSLTFDANGKLVKNRKRASQELGTDPFGDPIIAAIGKSANSSHMLALAVDDNADLEDVLTPGNDLENAILSQYWEHRQGQVPSST